MRGVGATLGAAAAFGAVSVLAKRAYEQGSDPVSLLGARVLVAAIVLAAVARPAPACAARPGLAPAAVAGLAFACAGLGEFEALSRAPAATVVLLLFVAPVWIALSGWAFRGARLGWARGACLAGLVAGLALLVAAPGGARPDTAAVVLALAASVMSAAFFVALDAAGRPAVPSITALAAAGAAAAVAIPLDPRGVADELLRPDTAGHALAIGALTACGLLGLASGVPRASAFTASAVVGAEPVVAAALAWLLLGEKLTLGQAAGAACVVLSVAAVSQLSGRAPPGPGATGRTRRRRPGSRPPPRPARSARRPR